MERQAWRRRVDQSAVSCTLALSPKVRESLTAHLAKEGAIWFRLYLVNHPLLFGDLSTQEAAERFGCHRLQSGGPGASAAGLLWACSDRAGHHQLWTRQWAGTHGLQRQGMRMDHQSACTRAHTVIYFIIKHAINSFIASCFSCSAEF